MHNNKTIYILLLIVCVSGFIWFTDFSPYLKGPSNLILGIIGIVIIKKQSASNQLKFRNLFLSLISISTIGSLLLVSLLIVNSVMNYTTQQNLYKNLIEVDLPKNIKVLKSNDTHSGPLGEGTFYTCIQLNKTQTKNFLFETSKNIMWKTTPLTDDLNKFMFGYMRKTSDDDYYIQGQGVGIIPPNIKHGIYYFKDIYAENYPEYKNKSILDETRSSNNFIFAILDLDTGKLYIMRLDT